MHCNTWLLIQGRNYGLFRGGIILEIGVKPDITGPFLFD